MRKENEIRHEIAAQLLIVNNQDAATEQRAAALARLAELKVELEERLIISEMERRMAASDLSDSEKRELQRFSFQKFIREAINGGLTGFELEMSEEARREAAANGASLLGVGIPYSVLANKRAATGQNVTTAADGGNLVNKEPVVYIEALRNALVLSGMGTTMLTGLVGNVPMVKGTAISASWGAEADSIAATKKTTTRTEMSPKRVAITTAYTKQLLAQTSGDIEMLLMDDMVRAHADALQSVAINGGGSNQPTGILATSGIGSVVIGDNGGAITWAKVVELETKVSTNNAALSPLNYLTNSKVIGAMKTIERATNTARYIMENGQANGYNVIGTNSVPSNLTKGTGTNLSAMIFGNFSDLIIGQWGGMDVVVDPYSLKKAGEVEVTLNAYHDVFLRRTESFAAIKDITS